MLSMARAGWVALPPESHALPRIGVRRGALV
jgi:hypothetical protein